MSITKIFAESLSTYNQSGKVTLYHYSREDGEQIILDPQQFGKHSFTRREAQTSDYPRIFFYLDPTQKERFFQSNTYNLYATEVKRKEIYDLTKDKKGLIQKVKDKNQGVLNFDMLFKLIDKTYNGVYYTLSGGSRDVVAWFNPISVDKQA